MTKLVLELGSASTARDLAEALSDDSDVDEVILDGGDERGIAVESVVVIVIASVAIITRVADWIRARNECLLIVDARGDEVKMTERCDLAGHRGKVILVAPDSTQLLVEAPTGVLDLDSLIGAVTQLGVEAAVEQAKAAGAEAQSLPPGSLDGL